MSYGVSLVIPLGGGAPYTNFCQEEFDGYPLSVVANLIVRHLLMLLVSVFSDYSGSRQQSSHKRIDTLPDNAATFRSKQQSQ